MTDPMQTEREELNDDERAEAMAYDALIYDLSVALMRLDGNEGNPHQLVWCGGPIPEPWGDAWQKYEPQAESVLNAIGEGSARALVEAQAASSELRSLRDQLALAKSWIAELEGALATMLRYADEPAESALDMAREMQAVEFARAALKEKTE